MSSTRLDLQRFRAGDQAGDQAQVWLEASQVLVRQGNIAEARHLLNAAVREQPDCAQAWLRLAWLTGNVDERRSLLQRVLEQVPDHVQARTELDKLDAPRSAPSRRRVWLLGLLIAAALAVLALALVWGPVERSLAGLLPTPTPAPTPTPTLTPAQIAAQFGPQLEAAVEGGDWQRALELVAIMQSVDPAGAEVRHWALAAHLRYGQALVGSGQVAEAGTQFDLAVDQVPDDEAALLWQETTAHYLAGQAAFAQGDWPAAIDAFSQAYGLLPGYGDLARQLTRAYWQKGRAAIEREDWPAAVETLLQARARLPDDLQITSLLSEAYRGQGQAAIDAGRWTAAINTLTAALEELPGDGAVAGLLVEAYRRRGIETYDKGKLHKARADLEAALALRPEDERAREYLDKVMYELFPPRRIEIDISKQRFYAWEGDTLVHTFATSTGLPGRDTATGHYRVLDKIPMAYSSVWNLKMPYWLGIYYVGKIENGIHALPIRPDGSVMWGGLLGQRASYGCVILSTEAARTIYNWAEIGTPVHIHY